MQARCLCWHPQCLHRQLRARGLRTFRQEEEEFLNGFEEDMMAPPLHRRVILVPQFNGSSPQSVQNMDEPHSGVPLELRGIRRGDSQRHTGGIAVMDMTLAVRAGRTGSCVERASFRRGCLRQRMSTITAILVQTPSASTELQTWKLVRWFKQQ